jgi:hypothetical protein
LVALFPSLTGNWLPITVESGGAEARHSGIFRKVSENSGDGAGKFHPANCMHRERTGQAKTSTGMK